MLGGETAFVIAVAAVLGLATGFGALGFRTLVGVMTEFAFRGASLPEAADALPWWWRVLLPAVGLVVVWPLCRYFAPEARGHGVPEVMDAVLHNGRIRGRVVVVKSLASAVTIGTGGSVGREGPIVQIGSAVGSLLSQILKLDRHRARLLVACGAASGIAATFNAPVAGVAFGIEIVLGSAGIHIFTPIVVSTVVATTVARQFVQLGPAFHIPKYALQSPWELATYASLGAVAGAIGALFTRMLYKTEDLFDEIPIPGWLLALGGGLIVGAIGVFRPEVYGLGYATIERALHGEIGLGVLLVLLVAKMVATSVTLAAGGSGGVFAPSLFLGAAVGGTFGVFASELAPWASGEGGAYALVGMGAVVAATTHAPLTAIIIIFELTADYAIMLPLMLACIISAVVSVALGRESIYTLKLARRGTDVKGLSEAARVLTTPVQDLLRRSVSTLSPNDPLQDLIGRVMDGEEHYHYVIDEDRHLLGVITLDEVRRIVHEDVATGLVLACDIMSTIKPVFVDDTLESCLARFGLQDTEELPVVDAHGVLEGSIARKDVIALYNRDVLRLKELALTFVSREEGEGREHQDVVELPTTHVVETVKIPQPMVGKTLAELDLRSDHGINVVEIRQRRGGRNLRFAPDPRRPLPDQGVLLVVGPRESVEWLRHLSD